MEDDIVMYTVKDLSVIFRCGINQAYSLAKANGFPSMKIGGKILTEKRMLEDWIKKHRGKSVITN